MFKVNFFNLINQEPHNATLCYLFNILYKKIDMLFIRDLVKPPLIVTLIYLKSILFWRC